MLEVKLVVVGGDAKSSEVRLKLPTIIGRGREAGLTVPHALVSRRHTEVFERDGKLFVRDLGSLNGTFVNNLKIDGEKILGPNQLLTLGNVTFRAVYEVSADELDETANSETVSFDEVKTQEVASKKKAASKSGQVALDTVETVPVDELKRAQAKPQAAEEAADQIQLDESEKTPSTSDTDKSFKTITAPVSADESISSIFAFDDEEQSADQSVAISALGDLPAPAKPAVSFVGNVDLGEDAKPSGSQIDSVDIDLGAEQKPAHDDDDSGLGSFLNKLPR